MTLGALTDKLRKRIVEFRWKHRFETKVSPAINFIEMALNITELAMVKSRPIDILEEHWFHEGWPVIHTLEDTEWEDIIDLYRTLTFKVQERNWFR
ncbi:MAG TPA: hypothetical protein PK511_06260 [Chitinophagales bacterium]|nr:hypothetical protein [Chitinophagales bacterium]HMX04858.1 hypothetical protein [Chitinophagales bacterium]HMZ89851.1 hypothetical protein [Chitinophagales bacterium]HNA58317.1 hypothetical protein [Chitinophagales bacterium]HNE44656.1 hypothetical protein [Chitinophagales bacterium]